VLILAYNVMQIAALPLCILGIPLYLLIKPSRRSQFFQRFGRGLERPVHRKTKTIWIHALSVGEVTSACPLVKELARRKGESINIIFSATTRSGRELAGRLLAPVCDTIIYFPFDVAPVVTYFLKKLNPDLFILIETDFWPNFIHFSNKAKVPILLFNGRISDSSMRRYRRFGFIFKPLFESFQHLCMQTDSDAGKLQMLGISPENIKTIGNLKFSDAKQAPAEKTRHAPPLPAGRFLLFGGSTHDGEETMLVDVFLRLRKEHSDLHLVIAPRNIERCDELLKMIQANGVTVQRYAAPSGEPTDITLIDTIGDLSSLYRHAALSFIGGSLVAEGGHNPLEAARFGCPVLFGPHMDDFSEISSELVAAGGALVIDSATGLYSKLAELISDEKKRLHIGANAKRYTDSHDTVLAEHLKVIDCFL